MKTKRGNSYQYIPQKGDSRQIKGYRKCFADYEAKSRSKRSDQNLTLSVRGTLDFLASGVRRYRQKLTKIQHPIDREYFKEAYKITPQGLSRLKIMRNLVRAGLPLWEAHYFKRKLP